MRLIQFMSTEVETIAAEEDAAAAIEKMKRRGVRHLVVIRDGEMIGIVSQRDLGGRNASRFCADQTVQDLMVRSVTTAEPRTTVRQAANLMRGRGIGCLPVMKEGKLIGIVTTSDLLQLLGRGDESVHNKRSGRPPRERHHLPRLPRRWILR